MPWFPVDDNLHSHPKTRKAGLHAIGLWTVAGSYSAQYLTGGFVPDWFVESWPKGRVLASQLCSAGLWKTARGGWQFHQWDERNRTKEDVEAKRAQDRERQKNWRAERTRHAVTNNVTPPVTDSVTHAVTNASVTDAVTNAAHTRPDQTRPISTSKETSVGRGSTSTRATPRPTCIRHPNGPDHDQPCRTCKAVREWEVANESWRLLEEAEQRTEQQHKAALIAQAAINDCPICDEYGHINFDDGTVNPHCTHRLDQLAQQ